MQTRTPAADPAAPQDPSPIHVQARPLPPTHTVVVPVELDLAPDVPHHASSTVRTVRPERLEIVYRRTGDGPWVCSRMRLFGYSAGQGPMPASIRQTLDYLVESCGARERNRIPDWTRPLIADLTPAA